MSSILKRHLTTRRGFVAAMGFGGLSLYGLWIAYGAAPGPLALLGLDHAHATGEGTGHGGHGAAKGPTADEFRRMTAAFVERYRAADGAVHPRLLPAGPAPEGLIAGHAPGGHDAHREHGAPAAARDDGVGDVFLLAEKWSYEPAHLRLDAGVPYRFRMLAADVSHGASIQFGRGGRMIRLRPNAVAVHELTFTQPGNYLVYCTIYCGTGHDRMQARIEVMRPDDAGA